MGSKKKHKRANKDWLELADIQPLTATQEVAFSSNKSLVLCGSAGSGKSFLACYFGCDALFKKQCDQIVLIRSAVPSRDIGFLPGTDKEKSRVYEEPYYDIFAEIMQRGDAYEILKRKNNLVFMTTSYLRGLTLRDSFIILDECQNLSYAELNTVMTRIGEGSKVIFCGDFKQTDLKKNGLKTFLEVLKLMNTDFDIIEFTIDDIVRSGLVKRYLIATEQVDLSDA